MSKTARCNHRVVAAVLTASILGALAMPAVAHVVVGQVSLRQLTFDADVVATARIVEPRAVAVSDDGRVRRPVTQAELLEVIKGEAKPGMVRFAGHGHGIAEYSAGETVLLFLIHSERSHELEALSKSTPLRFVSLQEHDAKFPLRPGPQPVLDAVREYARIETIGNAEQRLAALRVLTVKLLTSRNERLARSALADLVGAEDAPRLTDDDVALLLPVPDDPDVAIGIRIGILARLEARGMSDGPARWVRLLGSTTGSDLIPVIRAASAHPSPPVVKELLRIVESGDLAAAEAAIALGSPGNDSAVSALTRALHSADPSLRRAAIRGLGGIGTPAARAALERVASEHADHEIRRRATAELARWGD